MRAVIMILGLVLCFCSSKEDFPLKNGDESGFKDSLAFIPKDSLDLDTLVDHDSSQVKLDYRFLALGDSYTIGQSVEEKDRWPVQLYSKLQLSGVKIEKPEIIARTGWTTADLLSALKQRNVKDTFDLVSLLIGVNNQYRGYNIAQQELEFQELLALAIDFAGGDSSHVFVVSIPDYGVTPFGQNSDPVRIGREIDQYNSLNEFIANEYNVRYFNITPISREAKSDPELIAKDGLHPSGKMYSRWVSEIFPWVLGVLDD